VRRLLLANIALAILLVGHVAARVGVVGQPNPGDVLLGRHGAPPPETPRDNTQTLRGRLPPGGPDVINFPGKVEWTAGGWRL